MSTLLQNATFGAHWEPVYEGEGPIRVGQRESLTEHYEKNSSEGGAVACCCSFWPSNQTENDNRRAGDCAGSACICLLYTEPLFSNNA